MSPLNVIPSGVDSVSSNLRGLSIHLQQLKLVNTTIAYDFLCPLDEKGQPKPGSLQLNRPYLEENQLIITHRKTKAKSTRLKIGKTWYAMSKRDEAGRNYRLKNISIDFSYHSAMRPSACPV
ncbi:hypothetical protein PENNAL_c0043G09330 [Penicillium nalgiovense]|uniref:Uncharacterized protein n=1 Tax=Penicillium nalgiovense TaxID=60175 RepID=A0A1V6Y0E9_PENNA|nr:hypothetical protein PENNAL_c0043G09330 [Penicillium nalgiovense]